MHQAWWVAQREWLEQSRQPAMILVICGTFFVLAALVAGAVGALELAGRAPDGGAAVGALVNAKNPALFLREAAASVIAVGHFLLLGQMLGMVGVLAGQALLHDRQLHTLPFLLLAPLRRGELLAGKVLGAVAGPLLAYTITTLAVFGGVSRLGIAADASRLPSEGTFWVVLLLGTPAWAAAVATACALVSGAARDVRTAQQGAWFILLFATLGVGFLLQGLYSEGVALQLGVAAVGAGCAAGLLVAGSQLLRRDLGRT